MTAVLKVEKMDELMVVRTVEGTVDHLDVMLVVE
jgi:hypothetical protein